MRLGIVSTMSGDPWGGSEDLWADIALRAAAAGHSVVCSVNAWPRPSPRLAELAQAKVAVTTRRSLAPGPARRLPGDWSPGASRLLRDDLDVVLVSQGGTYDAMEGRRLFDHVLAGGVPYAVICNFNDDSTTPPDDVRRYVARWLSSAARTYFVSSANLDSVRRQVAAPLPNARALRVLPSQRRSAAAWPPRQSRAELAAVGRLDARTKGQDLLLAALAGPQWKQRDWRLRVYGTGPDDDYFRRLTRLLDLDARVELMGHWSLDDIVRDSHVVVLPSRAEGTPIAMLEALQAGRPVLATDVGGCREWLVEGVNGWLAHHPGVDAVADALETMWASRDGWEAMGRTAAARMTSADDDAPGSVLTELESVAGH